MKSLIKVVALSLLTVSFGAYATDKSHEDAAKMANATVKTKLVKYACQNDKKVNVKYGFNKQNQPTYAQATVNGKTRFMPINLNLSDVSKTHFGDDNNFSLAGDAFDMSNVKKSIISIQTPASEIAFKLCKAR